MGETTTIQITQEQKAQLDELKRVESESYKSVLQRLIGDSQESIESHNAGVDTDEIARKVVADLETRLPRKVAEELR
jgi:predicted CopG family antitoxin